MTSCRFFPGGIWHIRRFEGGLVLIVEERQIWSWVNYPSLNQQYLHQKEEVLQFKIVETIVFL